MADTSQGEGWWKASDGKWYRPEDHPDYVQPSVAPPATPPSVSPDVAPTSMPAPTLPGPEVPPAPGYWKASDGNWYPPQSLPGTPPTPGYVPMVASYPLPLPAGTTVSSRGMRFGNYVLGAVLVLVTLFIGYAIWALIVYGRGQTPAKQLLNMYVLDERTGQPASWGTMFVRGVLIDGLLGTITGGLFSLISALLIFSDDKNQRLTDQMVNTIVVDAPHGLPDGSLNEVTAGI